MKAVFFSALHAEAAPIIEHLGLSMDNSMPIPTFRGDEFELVVSGIGKVKSAAAVGFLAARAASGEAMFALNAGIAGVRDMSEAGIGELFLINKIIDISTSREFYPDMLIKSEIKETLVSTFDKPVTTTSNTAPAKGLVDMEASGFFEAASVFLPPHRIACLKVVSDYLEPGRLDSKKITALISSNVERIESYALKAISAMSNETGFLEQDDYRWLDEASELLRLTISQKHLLKSWVLRFKAQNKGGLPNLSSRYSKPATCKKEGKQRLEEIRKELFSE